jgi:4-hydroxy-3-methylbut-2-enyl diphosphate reductase
MGFDPPLRGGFIQLKRIPRAPPWAIFVASRREARRGDLAQGQTRPDSATKKVDAIAPDPCFLFPGSAHWYTGSVTTTLLDSISNGTHAETSPSQKRVLLLKPRGFCAGVVRAIDIVKIALETFGAPIYVRREIVHNRYVVNELAEKGAIFVHEIDDVPDGQRVIYSAHGVSPAVRELSKGRNLKVIDATCPLVTKVHIEAVKFARQGYSLVLIGHRDHDEIEGTLGEAPEATQVVSNVREAAALQVPDPNRVAYLTQTTLSLD